MYEGLTKWFGKRAGACELGTREHISGHVGTLVVREHVRRHILACSSVIPLTYIDAMLITLPVSR